MAIGGGTRSATPILRRSADTGTGTGTANPTSSGGSGGSTSTGGNAAGSGSSNGLTQLTPQMLSQLQAAIDQAFPAGFGTSANVQATWQQIWGNAASYLSQYAQWTPQMLALAGQSIAGWSGEQESKSGNESWFGSQLYNQVVQGINQGLAQNQTAPTSVTNTPSVNDESFLEDLLPYLEQANQSTAATPASSGDQSMPYYVGDTGATSGGGGGGNPVLGLLMLAAAVALGIYWYDKHHKKVRAE